MKPSIGKMVHFVENRIHRPATITHVFTDTCVNLNVLNDGTFKSLGKLENPSFMQTSVVEDPMGEADYSWHWPERME